MADAASGRRARFRLHLGTCVLLSVVAGLLIWANVVRYPAGYYAMRVLPPFGIDCAADPWGQGWPATYGVFTASPTALPQWYPLELALNTLTGLAVLISVGVPVEYFLRRRGRKGSPRHGI